MAQAVLRIETLSLDALEAAQVFHRDWVPQVRSMLATNVEAVAIVLPPAAPAHRDWRLAVSRDMARSAAPQRVNLVAGDCEAAVAQALAYLDRAPGITGQYLPLVGQGLPDLAV